VQEAEEELGKLPDTVLVKELKEANQARKNALIQVGMVALLHGDAQNIFLIKGTYSARYSTQN
jgi:hypothetical protein